MDVRISRPKRSVLLVVTVVLVAGVTQTLAAALWPTGGTQYLVISVAAMSMLVALGAVGYILRGGWQ